MFVSDLFLYWTERHFQKLISSSLEENDGTAFTSMTDRQIWRRNHSRLVTPSGVDWWTFHGSPQHLAQNSTQEGARTGPHMQ